VALNRWSQRVTQTSNALDLESSVFTPASPRRIAASLKRKRILSEAKGELRLFGK